MLVSAACGLTPAARATGTAAPHPAAAGSALSTRTGPPRPPAVQPTLVVLGDSLSAGYGLPPDTGWVTLLQRRLAQTSPHYSVSNASISGDTTSGGLSRLPAVLARLHPAIVIVELGGNDALRGLPLATTRQNLASIITLSQAAGARVVLVGMQIPPNYGQAYTHAFASLYTDLADHYHLTLVPFLLEGIADKPELFQADQIHPLPQAQPVLLDNVWKRLQALIQAKPPGSR
ncbi:arylesterase [Robbsia sp. Bb-Pol-6]|uniref:Arylesterase n=1 Tax=Robbsia betulipollinis TaxID=2981849 RepID=A0ABT3ZP02_9BURK|nr:arylesterase [Robbsia betulipollinis]MCY0388132.1 arylesterase [Robbsia betulipollinis]